MADFEQEMLAAALGVTAEPTATEQETTVTEVKPEATEVKTEVTEPTVTATTVTEPVPSIEDILKEKTGFTNWDELKTAIEKKPELQFANETSKKVAELLQAGKEEDLETVMYERKMLKDITKKSDEEQLKAFIKMQNPLFDDSDVQAEFDERYKADEFADSRQQKKIEWQKQQDLQNAKQFFNSKLEGLQLPTQPQPETNEFAEYEQKFIEGLGKVDSKAANIEFNFTDPDSKVSFPVKFSDEKTFQAAKEAAANLDEWLLNTYVKSGRPDKLVEDLYWIMSKQKALDASVSQVYNQTRVHYLKEAKNIKEPQQSSTESPLQGDEVVDALAKAFFG